MHLVGVYILISNDARSHEYKIHRCKFIKPLEKQSNMSRDVKHSGYNMYHFLNVKNSALCSSYVYVGII
jgi:hypothetical protein